jgi:hypothetical protein
MSQFIRLPSMWRPGHEAVPLQGPPTPCNVSPTKSTAPTDNVVSLPHSQSRPRCTDDEAGVVVLVDRPRGRKAAGGRHGGDIGEARRQGEPSGMGCGPNAAKTMPFSGSGFGLGETTGHPPMGFRALPEIVGRLGRGTIDESKTSDTDQSDAHARSCCPAGVRRAGGHFAGA